MGTSCKSYFTPAFELRASETVPRSIAPRNLSDLNQSDEEEGRKEPSLCLSHIYTKASLMACEAAWRGYLRFHERKPCFVEAGRFLAPLRERVRAEVGLNCRTEVVGSYREPLSQAESSTGDRIQIETRPAWSPSSLDLPSPHLFPHSGTFQPFS